MRWAEKPVFHVKHRGCEAFRCSSAAIAQDSAKRLRQPVCWPGMFCLFFSCRHAISFQKGQRKIYNFIQLRLQKSGLLPLLIKKSGSACNSALSVL